MDDDAERTEAGDPVYRHAEPPDAFQPAFGDSEAIARIDQHIETHLGKIELVFHEILSDVVHLDVHWVKPTKERNFHILVTSGMSDLPMTVPKGAEDFRYTELMIGLPRGWAIGDAAFRDERNYWPVRLLKYLARMPHIYKTWLGWGHTVPNGDPPEPFIPGSGLACALIVPPRTTPESFERLELDAEKTIRFQAVVPIYREEMNLKLKKGLDSLLARFDKYHVSEVLDPNRRNVARRTWWPF
jgi:hypothetical protein